MKKNSRPFAAEMLELKWERIRLNLPGADEERRANSWERNLKNTFFLAATSKSCCAPTIEAQIAALDGLDNELLVNLRADIEDLHPGAIVAVPEIQSEIAFREAFEKARSFINPVDAQDLRIRAGRETVSFFGGNVAAGMAIRVGGASLPAGASVAASFRRKRGVASLRLHLVSRPGFWLTW